MPRVNLHKAIPLYLSWLGLLTGALIICLSDSLPFTFTFVEPGNLFATLVQCQVFFVVLVWPFFIPGIVGEVAGKRDGERSVHMMLLQVAVLSVFAFPLALMCANVSDTDIVSFIRGHALVLALASFVAVLFTVGVERGWRRLGPLYFMGAFGISAGIPFLAFLLGDLAQTDMSVLSTVSPFWGASEIGETSSLVQAMLYGILAVAMLLVDAWRRKGVDASSPAG